MFRSPMLSRLLLVFLLFASSFAALDARKTDGPAKVAVMAAYSVETDVLLQEFGLGGLETAEPTRTVKGIRFYETEFSGVPIVIFETGMSPTNAAMSMQIALYEYHLEAIFFAGVAGGLVPELKLGDVVIAEHWRYHSEAGFFNPDGEGGYIVAEYFEVKYPNFGMIFPDDQAIIREGMVRHEKMANIPVCPNLLELSRSAIIDLPDLMVGERKASVSVGGLGTTGPVFVDNAEYREFLYQSFGAIITEMETAAYAHVAWVNQVPFLAVRGVSDLAGGQKGKNDERVYAPLAGIHAARVLKAILEDYAQAR